MPDPTTYRPAPGAIPTSPGVYKFRDPDGRVIYVGKAKSLRQRLNSYFADITNLHPRTAQMVTTAGSVEWTVVATEVEALQLEFTWINEFNPRFNVQFKDDKSYPELAVTLGERFPRLQVTRGPHKKGVKYFGPYAHAWAIRETLDLLLRVFPARTCSQTVFRRAQRTGRPCLLGYIGKCSAPCVGWVSEEEHRRIVEDFCEFMSGRTKPLIKRLEKEMAEASDALEFEKAARLRDDLSAVRKAMEKQAVVLSDGTDADVVGIDGDDLEAAVQVFHVRGGRIRGQRGWIVEIPFDDEEDDGGDAGDDADGVPAGPDAGGDIPDEYDDAAGSDASPSAASAHPVGEHAEAAPVVIDSAGAAAGTDAAGTDTVDTHAPGTDTVETGGAGAAGSDVGARLTDERRATIVENFLRRLYGTAGVEEGASMVPREILVPTLPRHRRELTEWLTGLRGAHVSLRVPRRGDKRDLATTVERNAAEALRQHRLHRASDLTARSAALEDIARTLGMDVSPLRIECIDISHVQGTNVAASLVVFEDALPKRSDYRRFTIKEHPGDDVASIAEVVRRRFTHVDAAGSPDDAAASLPDAASSPAAGAAPSDAARTPVVDAAGATPGIDPQTGRPRRFAYPPQLLVVDGGAPQVNAAAAVLADLGIASVTVCGLAKRLEEIWVPGQDDPVIFPRTSEALYLLQRLRDEAHRFAITFHRAKRSKSMTVSALDEVPGLGAVRKKALIAHFGSVAKIRQADADALTAVPGIGRATAEAIVAALDKGR